MGGGREMVERWCLLWQFLVLKRDVDAMDGSVFAEIVL